MDLFDRFVPNPKVLVVLRFDMIDVDFFSSIERNLLRVNRLRFGWQILQKVHDSLIARQRLVDRTVDLNP